LLTGDLVTTTAPTYDETGKPLITDGNEYGVYMTTNQHMAEVSSYGTPRHTDPLPGSPTFNYRGQRNVAVDTPRVGITYRIDTDGLEVRKPKIDPTLQGVYNNGFQGDEYIADHVPAEKVRVASFRVGSDLLHRVESLEVDGEDHQPTAEQVRQVLAARAGKLATAAQVIGELPEEKRKNGFAVERVIRHLKAPGKF
jgi:hypothetical protein